MPYVNSSKLTGYAVTGSGTSPQLPNAPTISSDDRLRTDSFTLWFGLLGPAGLPDAIASKIDTEMKAVLASPEIQASLKAQGIESLPLGGDKFGEFIKKDVLNYQRIIEDTGVYVN